MKITKTKEFRIIVEPSLWWLDEQEFRAQKCLSEIKRHVDCENAYIDHVTETVCSHCGLTWEEDADGPVCCGKAQDEWGAASK